MSKVTGNYLFVSLFILLFGTAGGSAMTRKMAHGNDELGWSFFWCWLPACLLLFLCQCMVFSKARSRLLFQLVFNGLMGLTLMFFLLSIILPVFWLSPMTALAKAILAAIFAAILMYNLMFGWQVIHRRYADIDRKSVV